MSKSKLTAARLVDLGYIPALAKDGRAQALTVRYDGQPLFSNSANILKLPTH